MIVPTMTVQEIYKEILEDVKNIDNKLDGFKKDFRKIVLRKSQYPVTKSYEYITKERNNLLVIGYTALKRSDCFSFGMPMPLSLTLNVRVEVCSSS